MAPIPLASLPPTMAAPLARPVVPADPAKLRKAAQDFEAMAIGQFLQPMFETVDTGHSLMVQEMGKQIAAHGGLGLAEPVYQAMLRMQEGVRS